MRRNRAYRICETNDDLICQFIGVTLNAHKLIRVHDVRGGRVGLPHARVDDTVDRSSCHEGHGKCDNAWEEPEIYYDFE